MVGGLDVIAQIANAAIPWLTEARRITPEHEEITLAVMSSLEPPISTAISGTL